LFRDHAAMAEAARWGESPPWSLGLEEELMLVREDTLLLEPAAAAVIEAASQRELTGQIKQELFASVVELTTGICDGAVEAGERLRALRETAAELAAERSLMLLATGSHPISRPEEQPIADEPRYQAFVDYARVSARRQGVNGLHVHVGMPDADTCFRALEGALQWLPVVLALSANSPYLAGEETGLASSRAEILAQLPRSGAPPAFREAAEWEAFVERLVTLGLIPDYTMLWWDIRPHPRFGTLEVRMPDQPTRVERSAGFAALIQALCVVAARSESPAYDPPSRAVYQQNRWAALRGGLDAELVHPAADRLAPARELVRELVDLVTPVAAELGSADLLAALQLDRTEGEDQLETGRREGLEAVVAELATRTTPARAPLPD
jgi:carboxylate-amine ligase